MSEELLTVFEVAEILKVHVNTIYSYLQQGKLKGNRIVGNRWRIKKSDLDKFIEQEIIG